MTAFPVHEKQKGFTFIALLFALLLLSLASQGVMWFASQQAQRAREGALLRIGEAYVQAIGAYYQASPGQIKQWPRQLSDLLEDRRLVSVRRHLREIYPDPMTRKPDWILITAPDGGIQGVRSRSDKAPIRMGPVVLDSLTLPAATQYLQWEFVYVVPGVVARKVGP